MASNNSLASTEISVNVRHDLAGVVNIQNKIASADVVLVGISQPFTS